MRTSYLWLATWAALTGGAGLMLVGWLIASEIGSMLTGYGLLVALSGAYLGAGLAIRDRVRHAASSPSVQVQGEPLLGRRVF